MSKGPTTVSSIAQGVDDLVLRVECPCCHRMFLATVNEVRRGLPVPCPNCEAWLPLWDPDGLLQGLYEDAVSVDRRMGRAI